MVPCVLTLFTIGPSPPGAAVRAMLAHFGVEHRVVTIPPGFHPLVVRARGFRRATVPALVHDGERVQGSLEITRHLHARGYPLFPDDPALRARVEEAERWGERDLQAMTRRPTRWLLATRVEARQAMARDHLPVPGAGLIARPSLQARAFARASGATEEAARHDVAAIPAALDRVGALLEEGVIGGPEPNAADFQLASCVRAIVGFPQLDARFGAHPAARWARERMPDFPPGLPPLLPEAWLPARG